MQDFEYIRQKNQLRHTNVKSIGHALSLLNDYYGEAKVIAGGTDLLRLLKNKTIDPGLLINIKTIPGLTGIEEDKVNLKIGPLTTIKDIELSPVIKRRLGTLADVAHVIASPHIRNMASLAGNLLQEVTCWYFRRPQSTGTSFLCRRKGGKECFAVTGDNTYHAIFGGNKCFAVCPSDFAVVLSVLRAKVVISNANGEREILLEDLYLPLGNTLKPNEIITKIIIPIPEYNTYLKFLKFRIRKTIDFALCSVALSITKDNNHAVSKVKVVLGGVAPNPYRATAVEDEIRGTKITESIVERAAKIGLSQAHPLSMNSYKIPIVETLIKRAILDSNKLPLTLQKGY